MINASRLRRLYRIMPDRVTVGFRRQTALGTYAAGVDVADAWWRPAAGGTTEHDPSSGVYTRSDREWYFPKTAYAQTPAVGDLLDSPVSTIDPATATWTVLGVDHAGALGAWKLTSVSLAIVTALRTLLTFERPSNTQDAAGRMSLASYSTLAANVPARVQPQDSEAGDVLGRRTLPKHFTAYCTQQVAVRAKDRATDGAGTAYTVLGYREPERLDALFAVDLEVIG